jgi:TRAP-type C4-dicarboxylate transport system permease small subunit
MDDMKDSLPQKRTWFDTFADVYSRIMIGVCVCVFAVMVFSVSYGVLGRYLTFVKAPRWTQELAILCMVWLCFISAGSAVKDDKHVRMTLIENIVSKSWVVPLKTFAYVLLALVNIFFVIYGAQTAILSRSARMAATGWPLSITYDSIVLGGLYGAVMSVYRIYKGVNSK